MMNGAENDASVGVNWVHQGQTKDAEEGHVYMELPAARLSSTCKPFSHVYPTSLPSCRPWSTGGEATGRRGVHGLEHTCYCMYVLYLPGRIRPRASLDAEGSKAMLSLLPWRFGALWTLGTFGASTILDPCCSSEVPVLIQWTWCVCRDEVTMAPRWGRVSILYTIRIRFQWGDVGLPVLGLMEKMLLACFSSSAAPSFSPTATASGPTSRWKLR